jgi:hypothetical protein
MAADSASGSIVIGKDMKLADGGRTETGRLRGVRGSFVHAALRSCQIRDTTRFRPKYVVGSVMKSIDEMRSDILEAEGMRARHDGVHATVGCLTHKTAEPFSIC